MQDEVRRGDRTMILVLLMVSLPCLLGAGYMTYRSLWFTFGVEKARGEIVEKTGEVPTLTVEYRTGLGQLRKIESAGSDLYKNYMVGDAITVYYERDEPSTARLNLFVEMWLLPVLLGVFGGFFFLPVLLMGGVSGIRHWFVRSNLDRDGQIVQAQYDGYRLTLDMASFRRQNPGLLGSVSLSGENGEYKLVHNGRERDPMDALVQHELGVRFIVLASWRNPVNMQIERFESEPVSDHPERRVRGGRVAVRVDRNNPQFYRFEPPFGPASSKTPPRSSVIE